MGGSFARTGLPGAVNSAAYDAANELTNWNGASISYDNNGNLLSDGSNLFSWNARDELATINNLSLQYDAAGRRIKNGAGRSYLFDGSNPTQELSGSTPIANILAGGIDEYFRRTDNDGTVVPINDALGSIIALADESGNLNTQYTYDPFGNTTTSGMKQQSLTVYRARK